MPDDTAEKLVLLARLGPVDIGDRATQDALRKWSPQDLQGMVEVINPVEPAESYASGE